ncbi:AMP-binding protein [Nocardia sp. alder85J]|uniref:AMP-binding protein n=1 Tax=Nocardia sp. alder85J TaxID=2862949 RepID=UPI001CD1A259|nr:AMP-binding protein [Nocardia sp. alder85J]MCX4091340.1 AMP-binding protein [Nocardia sp. alder85J]
MFSTVDEVFRDRVRRTPDAPVADCGRGPVTFAELDARTDRLAAGLTALGVRPGDRIALIVPNRAEMIELLIATAKCGAVQVPLNYWLRGEFLRYQLADCGARLLIADDLGYASAAPLLGETEIEQVVLLDPPPGEPAPDRVRYADLLATDAEWTPRQANPSDLLAILYTSGTTALPKGCMLSTGYYVTVGRSYGERGWVRPGDRVYTAFPLFHSSGQMVAFMSALVNDADIVVAPEFHAATFMADARAAGATMLVGVGVMAQAILEQPPHPDDATSRFRLASWVPLPADRQEEFEARFATPVMSEGYGQTECVPISASAVDGRRVRTSSGLTAPLIDVRIVDEHDDEVPTGRSGEIVVRPRVPDATFHGYWNKPAETVATWRDLWHHTGDFGLLDADGYLHFVDRKKDVLRRRGENVSSLQLEQVIRTHPAVADIAVCAVPAPLGDDDIKACVVLEPDRTFTPADLFEFLRDRVPYFAIPRYLQLRTELPVNALGRVMKHVLRDEGVGPDVADLEALGLVVPRDERRGPARDRVS